VTFRASSRAAVKQKALAWWSAHSAEHGLSMRAFLAACRMDASEQVITFTPPEQRRSA